MRLDTLAVAVRPRDSWESIDLGFSMIRHFGRAVFASWLAIVMPVIVFIELVCIKMPWLGLLLVWWLKPLFDRIPLYIVSQAVFGTVPTVRQTLSAVPRLWSTFLLWPLTIGRFDPARSFHLPVFQLEGLRGYTYRSRVRVLRGRTRKTAVWLTVVCMQFGLVVALSLVSLANLLIPAHAYIPLGRFFLGPHAWMGPGGLAAISIIVVEPFYVAGGFALYLNRRILLEGWDIELAFRRMATRTGQSTARAWAPVLLIYLTGVAMAAAGLWPGPGYAVQLPPPPQMKRVSDVGVRLAIADILRQPEFQTTTTGKTWKYIGQASSPSRDHQWLDAKWLRVIGTGLEILLWTLLASALVWLIVQRANRHRGATGARPKPRAPEPPTVLGLSVAPASLPRDITAAARSLSQEGQYTAALSLLYRAALAYWVTQARIKMPAGATEGDCLRLVNARGASPRGEYFARLTAAWGGAAYGSAPPQADKIDALASEWARHFGADA
ncbi:MAG: hypothetical protein M0T84_11480 [Betaproteobacteria bacterium]|nr:hypothetical protein [Betaproteobacteria bacterium]